MNINRIIPIALTISTIAFCTSSWATPKQYRSGYNAGAAIGTESGTMDGSGESGTNSMHTNATCSIEYPKSKDFDRGYDAGCRKAYEQSFDRAFKHRKPKK